MRKPHWQHTGSRVSGQCYAFAIYRDKDAMPYAGPESNRGMFAVQIIIVKHGAKQLGDYHAAMIPADSFTEAHEQGEAFAHCWRQWLRIKHADELLPSLPQLTEQEIRNAR